LRKKKCNCLCRGKVTGGERPGESSKGQHHSIEVTIRGRKGNVQVGEKRDPSTSKVGERRATLHDLQK